MAVIFQNEENGYTVARVVTDEGEQAFDIRGGVVKSQQNDLMILVQ